MKTSTTIFAFLFYIQFSYSQAIKSYSLHFGDTVNVIDEFGLKQGRWVYLGQDKKEAWFKDYQPNQIVEDGKYKDGKRTGNWSRYHTTGKIQRETKYSNDTIDGMTKYYNKSGLLISEGYQKGSDFIDDYFIYDSSGKRFKKEASRKNQYAMLQFSGKVEKIGKGLANVKIRVKREDLLLYTTDSDAKGNFALNLELGFEYVISFKKEGFNDQSVLINTNVGDISDTTVYKLPDWTVSMSDNMANSLSTDFMSFLLNKPADKIYFNSKKKVFTADGVYVNLFKRQLKGIKKSTQILLAQAAEDKKQLEIENLKMEAAQKMNEIYLLKQSQDLIEAEITKKEAELTTQRLEKEKNKQALELADQEKKIKELKYTQQQALLAKKQIEAEKNAKEVEHLAILKKMQDLELRDKQKKLNETNESLNLSVAENKKRQAELDLTKREKQIQENEMKQKMFYFYILILGFVLIFAFAIVVYRNLQAKKKANIKLAQQSQEIYNQKQEIEQKSLLLEQKNTETEQSIQYAKRIQTAILPPHNIIGKYLNDYFILYKSKDIVSGDFYFFSDKHAKDGFVHIASVDCTGHGVPGAFMSVIGHEKLTGAVHSEKEPSKILSDLNRGIKTALRQSSDGSASRDGMDLSLCSIPIKNSSDSYTIAYSGANRPLWIARKDSNQIEEIKATKFAIGGFTDDNQQFEQHQIQLKKGDTIYLFSDGFADQFGGVKKKKLMTGKFKDIILGIQSLGLQDQKDYLDNFITSWMDGIEQIDDILVIGIKL
ncbi:MAG: SpoIIE family protein phosphatase [Flavobacteriales bacterium]|nr:SpoIIE family protein phosphatase [Flavobacteriales bacterium]